MISNAMIQKWIRMLRHDSVLHVEQTEGKYYSASEIAGYYNDFSGKVRSVKNFDENGIPFNTASYGAEKKKVHFPIAIFQYGLGAYDIWLETKNQNYYNTFLKMADWAIKNQESSGAWNTFGVLNYGNPYSSMAQGEGASLLARAYKETNNEIYRDRCKVAVQFMLTPVEKGGTTEYLNNSMILKEYPEKPTVLNGWMFSGFGLLDCWMITYDEQIKNAWMTTVEEIENALVSFDSGIWSYYDASGKYASPFYHSLHVELLKAYYNITGSDVMRVYEQKWTKYKNSWVKSKIAFALKAGQKISEEKTGEWVFVE